MQRCGGRTTRTKTDQWPYGKLQQTGETGELQHLLFSLAFVNLQKKLILKSRFSFHLLISIFSYIWYFSSWMCDILIFSPFIDDWLLYHFLPFTFSLNFFILEGGKLFSHLIFTFSIISNFCCQVAKVNFLSFYFHIFTYTYTHFFSLFGQVANFPFLSFHFYIFFLSGSKLSLSLISRFLYLFC